jgi:hypothetical protein
VILWLFFFLTFGLGFLLILLTIIQRKMSEEEETRIVSVASCAHKVHIISHGDFVDPTPKSITKKKWSSTAPDWRTATRGLNLEGKHC